LRVYCDPLDPDVISKRLKIRPTKIQRKGEVATYKGKNLKRRILLNGWFLETEGTIKSKDSRRHIDLILSKLEGKARTINQLVSEGIRIEIACFWRTKQGHGGPTLGPHQFKKLATLTVDFWYDFYC
jgi:hypothetical protein